MNIRVFEDKGHLGKAAAEHAACAIRRAILDRGSARIIAATAASQKEFLEALTSAPGIDWHRVELFHLDEYIGLPITHPGSFRKMLLGAAHPQNRNREVSLAGRRWGCACGCRRASAAVASAPSISHFSGSARMGILHSTIHPQTLIRKRPISSSISGRGCRRQQVGEAWFSDISQVPQRAISMSVRQIMKVKEVLAIAPDSRKAEAVQRCFEGESVQWRLPPSCAIIRRQRCISTNTLPPC